VIFAPEACGAIVKVNTPLTPSFIFDAPVVSRRATAAAQAWSAGASRHCFSLRLLIAGEGAGAPGGA
jgi:hypothetical protein